MDPTEIESFDTIADHNVLDYSVEFEEFAIHFMEQYEMELPKTPGQALNLHIFLLEKIKEF